MRCILDEVDSYVPFLAAFRTFKCKESWTITSQILTPIVHGWAGVIYDEALGGGGKIEARYSSTRSEMGI